MALVWRQLARAAEQPAIGPSALAWCHAGLIFD
jgi:hypothetical protein